MLTGVASATTATLTLTGLQANQAGSYSVVVTGSCPGGVTSSAFSLTVNDARPPAITTQAGHPYPAGLASLTISQNVGDVVLTTSGCPGGTLTWAGGGNSTLAVSTITTGTQTFTATCSLSGCVSPVATATITVVPPSLRVLHREATNNDLFTTAIKPYLIIDNIGNQPIPYRQITLRYWLTVENPAPLTNLPVYYAQAGTAFVHPVFVTISPSRAGGTGYVEYRFDAQAGSLPPLTNSGPIENGFSKQDYSPFNQADDYSFVLNRDYAPNQRITAYIDNQLVWGQEPPAPGTAPAMPLTLTVTATSAVIPTTANTTLIANAAGGSGLYTYTFSGPGTLTPNGNTAVASNLPAGVQTFTLLVTDTTTPTPLTIAATVSVTVSSPAPVNTPPTPTVNAGQTATAGQGFAYTVPAFTDLETPGILTYTARINPTNGFSFQADTRLLSGTPTLTGLSSVTITATDPGGLSASTTFTITVAPTPVVVVPASLQVLHRDAGNGQLTTNAIYPYFIVENTGNTAIPYSELTVRYWLTVENPAPVTNLPVYNAGVGAGNVQPVYVSLNQVRTGATGYVEYRFGAGAGSLAAMSNSGVVSTAISKADYSPFAQDDDYSYTLNRDFVLNARMTAYVSGRLVWGSEPPVATRLAAGSTDAGLQVTVLGNPAGGGVVSVEVRGAGGQPLRLVLTDISGRLVSEQGVEQAEAVERQTLMADHLPTGLLLLRVSPPTRSQIVKVLKP